VRFPGVTHLVLGFQTSDGCRPLSGGLPGTAGEVWVELHPDKTRRIEFGRYAEQRRKRRGEGKPETFDFLGFTHISGTNRKGYFTVKRQSSGKRMRAKLQQIKQQLRSRMHHPVAETGKWLKSVVQGYFHYHAVPGNLDRLGVFREKGNSALATDFNRSQPDPPAPLDSNAHLGSPMASPAARAPPVS